MELLFCIMPYMASVLPGYSQCVFVCFQSGGDGWGEEGDLSGLADDVAEKTTSSTPEKPAAAPAANQPAGDKKPDTPGKAGGKSQVSYLLRYNS